MTQTPTDKPRGRLQSLYIVEESDINETRTVLTGVLSTRKVKSTDDWLCSLNYTQLPAGEQRKCESILSMRHQVFVVSEQTGRGGIVYFPWLSVWKNFYSKADCTVSGCLYTISIIMEGEGPLPHSSPLCDDTSSASQSVIFFFFHSLLRLAVFPPGVCRYRRSQCVFDCSIHLPDSFIRLHGGCVCMYSILLILLRHTDVMLSVFATRPGSSRSQGFYKRKWQNVDATACRHMWNSALGYRKLRNSELVTSDTIG